jgi:HrpA-like RNA helicase
VKGSVETVIKIAEKEPAGDILIFLTGHEEVESASRLLKDYAEHTMDSDRRGDFLQKKNTFLCRKRNTYLQTNCGFYQCMDRYPTRIS